ncbi:MAG: response regulator [Candidatus Methanofastidiosia archaeon]
MEIKGKLKVLIVDDEPSVLELLSVFLSMNGNFEILMAENGKVALEMYETLKKSGEKPDIILMDLRMPVMDGIEATRKIRKSDSDANIYVVTAYVKNELTEKALRAGAKDILNKSLGYREIARRVSLILGGGYEGN